MEIKKRDLKGSISKVTQRNLECQEESSDSQIFLTAWGQLNLNLQNLCTNSHECRY